MKRSEERPLSTCLVCGFLGAGKTTFILERLRDKSVRTVVLVNELGTLGIDGQTIRTKGGVDVVEMAGGCICCSQRQGLVKSVIEMLKEEGIRNRFKVIIGGGPISQGFADRIGADGYADNATSAVRVAKSSAADMIAR